MDGRRVVPSEEHRAEVAPASSGDAGLDPEGDADVLEPRQPVLEITSVKCVRELAGLGL